jgi:hypothetical protein
MGLVVPFILGTYSVHNGENSISITGEKERKTKKVVFRVTPKERPKECDTWPFSKDSLCQKV